MRSDKNRTYVRKLLTLIHRQIIVYLLNALLISMQYIRRMHLDSLIYHTSCRNGTKQCRAQIEMLHMDKQLRVELKVTVIVQKRSWQLLILELTLLCCWLIELLRRAKTHIPRQISPLLITFIDRHHLYFPTLNLEVDEEQKRKTNGDKYKTFNSSICNMWLCC